MTKSRTAKMTLEAIEASVTVGFEIGRETEREAIVAWLRSHKASIAPIEIVRTLTISQSQALLVNAIEAGEHLK